MARCKSSIEALQQLLHLGTHDRKISDKSNSNVMRCQITKASKGEYQKCMVGMKRNLKQTLEIAETVSDPKIKL